MATARTLGLTSTVPADETLGVRYMGTVGPVLLVLTGLSFVVAGFARNDCSSELQACEERVNAGDVSWHHGLHDALASRRWSF